MQLALTQIPSGCNTVEKLVTWGVFTLLAETGAKSILEARNTDPERVVQYQIFESPNGSALLNFRITLPLSSSHVTDTTGKLWTKVGPLVEATIPGVYTTN